MATDARTWFYTTPEPRPYYIEERVNSTLWKNRLQNIYMTCTNYTGPYRMEGRWYDMPVQFEWEPGKYFILRTSKESKELVGVLRQILMMPPVLSYIDSDGMYSVEWQTDGGEARWSEVQGNPKFQGLRRLVRWMPVTS
jgi:hypothetical protein